MDWAFAMKLFAAMFAIMNPLSTIPVFLALTADRSAAERRQTMVATVLSVSIGAVICAFAGQKLLAMFGIDVNHFRLSGGLIVLLIALSMLSGSDHSSQQGSQDADAPSATSLGIYPLAIPIALGPGTIATIIIFAQTAEQSGAMLSYYAGLGGYLVFFAACFAAAPLAAAWIPATALSVIKRLMGLILAAIAAEMIVGALGALFPAWLA